MGSTASRLNTETPMATTEIKPAIKLSRGDKVILATLKTDEAQDAYALRKAIPMSPMEIGRALHRMEKDGLVSSADPIDTCNDLARTFIRC